MKNVAKRQSLDTHYYIQLGFNRNLKGLNKEKYGLILERTVIYTFQIP